MNQENKGLKIAVSGKGGVGKTTLAAALAKHLAASGYRVIAVDADPDANLAQALGVSQAESAKITPIAQLKELVAERTGTEPGSMGGFFSLNPKVDDIPEKYYLEKEGIRLLVLGTVENAGLGCICPESALLRRLIQHLVLERNEAVVLDMEAGLEHFGRATAQGVSDLIVVVEPGQRSIQTAKTIFNLAKQLSMQNVFTVLNKITSPHQAQQVKQQLGEVPVLGIISTNSELVDLDLTGQPVWSSSKLMTETKKVFQTLIQGG